MDLKLLEEFHALVQYGTIAKASKVLNVDPSTFGKDLRKIEKYYGVELFTKHNHGPRLLELTEAGYCLKQQAEKLVWLSQKLDKQMKEVKNGLGYMLPITVSPALSVEFYKKCILSYIHEKGPLRYELTELSVPEQEQRIIQGKAELGFANSPISNPHLFTILKEIPTKYYVIFHKESGFFNHSSPVELKELENIPLSLATSSAPKLINFLESDRVHTDILCTNLHRSTALLPVRSKLAVTLFPLAAPYEDEELRSLPLAHPLLKSRNVLYVQKNKALSETGKKFLDYALTKL